MSGKHQPRQNSPLVVLRLRQGLTQEDLAAQLGKTKQCIRNWEHGKAVPRLTIKETKLLCKLLKVSLHSLPDQLGSDDSLGAEVEVNRRLVQLSLT